MDSARDSSTIGSRTTRSQAANHQLAALNVEHDADSLEFFIRIGPAKAFISYWHDAHNVVVMEHTEVPAKFGGRGIGKHLAKVSVDFAAVCRLHFAGRAHPYRLFHRFHTRPCCGSFSFFSHLTPVYSMHSITVWSTN